MTNKLVLGLLAATAVATPAAAQRLPAAVVAVVDSGRIYAECTACRAALTQLQSQATALQTRQQALAAPIQTEGQAIEAAINALPAAQRQNPPAALQQRVQRWQQSQQTANQELQGLQTRLQSTQAHVRQQLDARLGPIINQAMVARGANIAVDTDATLARANGVDITNDVLTALNAQVPSVSVTPLPQQAQPAQPRPTGR
ncbi:Skp family chaperone for outer membrane proteins [Sphingomonas kaistensis]|uniref:Skp family chaperone for outer membrane proteins n=1 Tax=Sphingomonas kaistensis TaxID=298708 RepID=A0A7X5Y7J5_9SPHN|nr:OmpH family outer membrane protein [Sphingomonas kaistensis]NJC06285.1 Skp family chaperone for outer membrane proteins [Sphingomonas kaistensis]